MASRKKSIIKCLKGEKEMNIKEAYKKVKELGDERNYLDRCYEFNDKWYFFFFDKEYPSDEKPFGGGYDVIDQKTGEITFISTGNEEFHEAFEKDLVKKIDVAIFK